MQPQSGDGYGASVPDTTFVATRTKAMDRTRGVDGMAVTLRGSDVDGAIERGTITTSPNAVSVPAFKLKLMLPLRPVSALLYSPLHSPVSTAISRWVPTTWTGDGLVAQAAAKRSADGARWNRMEPPGMSCHCRMPDGPAKLHQVPYLRSVGE